MLGKSQGLTFLAQTHILQLLKKPDFICKTKFINLAISRLMSNVIDNETGRPLADGKVTHIIDWCGRKIGLVRIDETNYFYLVY